MSSQITILSENLRTLTLWAPGSSHTVCRSGFVNGNEVTVAVSAF